MKIKIAFLLVFSIVLCFPALAQISILNPWVSATTGPNAALFMEIKNAGDKPDKLIKVRTNEALWTDLHNHVDVGNGTLHMAVVDSIDIPPRGTMYLRPGGHHIMLRKISHPFVAGRDILHVLLDFESGQIIHVTVPVRSMGPMID